MLLWFVVVVAVVDVVGWLFASPRTLAFGRRGASLWHRALGRGVRVGWLGRKRSFDAAEPRGDVVFIAAN